MAWPEDEWEEGPPLLSMQGLSESGGALCQLPFLKPGPAAPEHWAQRSTPWSLPHVWALAPTHGLVPEGCEDLTQGLPLQVNTG